MITVADTPELLATWHPTKNMPLIPSEIGAASARVMWWQGACGHEWDAAPTRRKNKSGAIGGCPVCRGRRVLAGFNDIPTLQPDLLRYWDYDANDLRPEEVLATATAHYNWRCENGHEWSATPVGQASVKNGCSRCSGKRIDPKTTSLLVRDPAAGAEWLPELNGGLTLQAAELSYGRRKATWRCANGHDYLAEFSSKRRGSGCPVCAGRKLAPQKNDLLTLHPDLAAQFHPTLNGDLTPSKVRGNGAIKYYWLCDKGHTWYASLWNRIAGRGCHYCSGQQLIPHVKDLATKRPDLAAEWHLTKNDGVIPSQVSYGTGYKAWWLCSKGHEWQATVSDRTKLNGTGCPSCSHNISKAENAIAEYLRGLGLEVEQSNRKILGARFELDLYVPEKKVGIEFNGLYWHTEGQGNKTPSYHHDKWQRAQAAGIQLIQVWEDDWNVRPETVKRALAHKLGVSDRPTVFARKTAVVEVSTKAAQVFLEANHIQGYAAGTHYLALQSKGETPEIVALMVLKREGTGTLNIVRYATGTSVPGGFTKLLVAAERMYAPERFLTFSDHAISDGGLYANNGFTADKELKPDYMYVVAGERRHKFGYRLKRFREDPELTWQDGLTERELAALNGIPRIWDAGKTRWVREVATSASS